MMKANSEEITRAIDTKNIENQIDTLLEPFQKPDGERAPLMLLYDSNEIDLRASQNTFTFGNRGISNIDDALNKFTTAVAANQATKAIRSLPMSKTIAEELGSKYPELTLPKNVLEDKSKKGGRIPSITELAYLIAFTERKSEVDLYRKWDSEVAKIPDDNPDKPLLKNKCVALRDHLQHEILSLGKDVALSIAALATYKKGSKMLPLADYRLIEIFNRNKQSIVNLISQGDASLQDKPSEAIETITSELQLSHDQININQCNNKKKIDKQRALLMQSATTTSGAALPVDYVLHTRTILDKKITPDEKECIDRAYANSDIHASEQLVTSIKPIAEAIAALRDPNQIKSGPKTSNPNAKTKTHSKQYNSEANKFRELLLEDPKNATPEEINLLQKALRTATRIATNTPDTEALNNLKDDIYVILDEVNGRKIIDGKNTTVGIQTNTKHKISQALYLYSGQQPQFFRDMGFKKMNGVVSIPKDEVAIYDFVEHHIFKNDGDSKELKDQKRALTQFITNVLTSSEITIETSAINEAEKRIALRTSGARPNQAAAKIPATNIAKAKAIYETVKSRPIPKLDEQPRPRRKNPKETNVIGYLGQDSESAYNRLDALAKKNPPAAGQFNDHPEDFLSQDSTKAPREKDPLEYFSSSTGVLISLNDIAKGSGIALRKLRTLMKHTGGDPINPHTLEADVDKLTTYLEALGKSKQTSDLFREKLFTLHGADMDDPQTENPENTHAYRTTDESPNGSAIVSEVIGTKKREIYTR